MAERLKECITKIIHEDETGFVPKRDQKKVHFITNTMEFIQNKEERAVFTFLEAGKVLDNPS